MDRDNRLITREIEFWHRKRNVDMLAIEGADTVVFRPKSGQHFTVLALGLHTIKTDAQLGGHAFRFALGEFQVDEELQLAYASHIPSYSNIVHVGLGTVTHERPLRIYKYEPNDATILICDIYVKLLRLQQVVPR